MAGRNSYGISRNRSTATAADQAEGVNQIAHRTTQPASPSTGVPSMVSYPATRSSATAAISTEEQGVLTKQGSFTAASQDGAPTVQTERLGEDFALLSTSVIRRHKRSGHKGKGKRTKEGKKHRGSYGRDQQSHDGCDQEIRKRTSEAASNSVSAVQERAGEASSLPSSNRPFNDGSRGCAEEEVLYHSQGSEKCIRLLVKTEAEVTDYNADDANIGKGWSKRKHRHGSKHKHKKHRSMPGEVAPAADTDLETEVTRTGVTGTEHGSQLLSTALQTATKETVSTANKRNGGASGKDVPTTTANAILKQSEALFPTVADKSTLKREEDERRKRILSQRSSTISKDFFLWGKEDTVDDPLQKRNEYVDELAGVSPEFSQIASHRKQCLLRHSSRNRAGMSPCDSRSVSSRSDFQGSPEAPQAQSPVKESGGELKSLNRNANELGTFPRAFGYGPVSGSMLKNASATAQQLRKPKKHSSGSMTEQVLAEPNGSGTSAVNGGRVKKEAQKGRSSEDTDQPQASASSVIERAKDNRIINDAVSRTPSNIASGTSPDADSFSVKQRPQDTNSLSAESQKGVSSIQSKKDDDSSVPSSFAFVPDLDRKTSEQSDMSWTLPCSSADPRISKLASVPTSANATLVYSKALQDNSSNDPADAAALLGAVPCHSIAGREVPLHAPEKALVRVPYGTTSQPQGCGCINLRCPDHAAYFAVRPFPLRAQLGTKQGVLPAASGSDLLLIESGNVAAPGTPVKMHETVVPNLEGNGVTTRPECTKETHTTGLVRSAQASSPGISSSRNDPGARTDLNASYSAVLIQQLPQADGVPVEYKVGECEITGQSKSKVNLSTSRVSRECTELETEVKLMMGLPTKEPALKPEISMDDFHALAEGQGCVTLDRVAPNDEEEEMWREIDVVEPKARATLVRSHENLGENDEAGTVRSDTKHENSTPLPDRKREPRIRQPVNTTSAESGTAHASSVQAKQEAPLERSDAAQSLTNPTGTRQDAPQFNEGKDSSKRQRRASEGAARTARRSSLEGHNTKSPSSRRRSLDHGRDTTLSPTVGFAASRPSEDRGSVETADLYPVKTQRWKPRPCVWRELSAVMERPVSIGVSAPGLNEIVLIDEDEAPDEPNALPVCTQVSLQDFEISSERIPTSSSIKRHIVQGMSLLASRSKC